MLTDLRFALRSLRQSPGYVAIVVLTLAFGIAINVVIFGRVNTLFLEPLPVRDADRLVSISERSEVFNMPHGLSFLDFQDIRAGSKSFTDSIAFFSTPASVSIPGQKPERGWIQAVSPDAFAKTGIGVALGRPLQPSDGDLPPGQPVAVITHRYWQNHFAGDPGVVGRPLILNGKQLTIVGVVTPGFDGFAPVMTVNLFVSTGTYAQLNTAGDWLFKSRGGKAWKILGYRRPGLTTDAVNAELAVFARRFIQDFPEEHRNTRLFAVPEARSRPDPAVAELMPAMVALFTGLCALVLAIACANVANLMSARALTRERELVVRSALGASRWQLIRQPLLESVLLALLSGLVGYGLSIWGSEALSRSIPTGDMPVRSVPAESWRMFGFAAGVSLVAGLLTGLIPALRSSRRNLIESLKQGAGNQAGTGRHHLRNLLVIGQVAVSCVVLISSALFLRALNAAGTLDLGFRPNRLMMLSLDLGLQGYDETRGLNFQKQALERVRALPGVESAGFTRHAPFNYFAQIRDVWTDNATGRVPHGHLNIACTSVSPDYLTMMGVPLQRGRDLMEADDAKSQRVAVINEAMARAIWPGQDPIGQHFRLDRATNPPIEVVGLTSTGKYVMLTEEPRPYFYFPQAQGYGMPVTLFVRAKFNPVGLTQPLREIFHGLDPDLPLFDVRSFEDHLDTSIFALMPLRTGIKIAAIQGALALALSVLGLYSVVAYGVANRTREIGLRMALGATQTNVLQFISREGLRLTLIGLAVGLSLSVLLALGLSRVLFGVHPFDPLAYLGVGVVLLAIASLACWLPARRATQVDPMVALRAE